MRARTRKKILILCPSPRGTAATQRLKYEQYLELLASEGYTFHISAFQTRRFWKIIYRDGRTLEKIFWTVFGYLRRALDLARSPFYDGVFVNLWVTPLGLPVFERMLFLFNRRVIYDIDDMIFMPRFEHVKENIFQKLKGKKKPLILMKHARYVIACTPQLTDIAAKRNKFGNAVDISSTLNTDRFRPPERQSEKYPVVLGWTGTHSSFAFLRTLAPVLKRVCASRRVELLVIANKVFSLDGLEITSIPWREETEVRDLHRIDIGLYPIPANDYSLGKSSLKALTYMSVGIPVVATAYGANFRVIHDGVEGFLAKDEDEWFEKIIRLIDNPGLRKQMGRAGRERVQREFSVEANFPKYMQVFKAVINGNG
ncbi:MAG TPA: glycosyltransferase family 4 protein [Chitinophagaceae bacterium]|nr:glycosyltransferase family 4 protein [Chitinophagaceae bacterium]